MPENDQLITTQTTITNAQSINPDSPTQDDSSPETTNLDQTDFYDQSSFSLSEKEVFPPLKFKKSSDKPPSPYRKLFILTGVVVGFLLVLLLVVFILAHSQGRSGPFLLITPESTPGQIRLQELKSQIQSTSDLRDSLVLPQIQQPITP